MDFDSFRWTGVRTQYNALPLLIRVIRLPKGFPKEKYPQRLNIFWKMSETHENGLPSEQELKRLETFENRLIDAVQHDEQSILVGALTCNGEKEFIFHTADAHCFIDRLEKMPQEPKRYPITIQKYDDPKWSYFAAVIPGKSRSRVGRSQNPRV